MLWHCWFGNRKGIRPVKTKWWGAGVVICLKRGADLHMAQRMLLPLTASCFSKIQIGFTFLVLAHPGSPGKRAVKQVCVCALRFIRRQVLHCSGTVGWASGRATSLWKWNPTTFRITKTDHQYSHNSETNYTKTMISRKMLISNSYHTSKAKWERHRFQLFFFNFK